MLNFTRVKSQNFYIAVAPNKTILLRSYNTIVGIYDHNTNELHRARYTHTTGKQITKWSPEDAKNIYVSQDKLKEIIKDKTNLIVNTNY